MMKVANLVCKTVGIAGMSAVLYDAYGTAQHHSHAETNSLSADVYEKAVAAQLSNTNESHISGAMQKKIANLRMENPLVPLAGKVKGFVKGSLESLADNIIPVTLSTLAIATKGFLQKAGAWGLGIYGAFQIAREGFGVGKTSSLEE